MIFVLKPGADDAQVQAIAERIRTMGYNPHVIRGVERTIIGAVGDDTNKPPIETLEAIPGVEQVLRITKPYKLASREGHPGGSVVRVRAGESGHVDVGGKRVVAIAGPCSIESEEQITGTARAVKASGASMLRGGAFKPRTSPYSFQGKGAEGLMLMVAAREATGLPLVTEVMDTRDVELVAEHADVLQIGARNCQNFSLLKEVGRTRKPVLLKRGLSTTIKELLMSAEYVLAGGNPNVILCERGIRTFEPMTRNTLDLSAIPVLKQETHLPVIIDPSHGVGFAKWVEPMVYASIAAGADGVMIEVHPTPAEAWSDGEQALTPQQFADIMKKLGAFAEAAGREL